MLATRPKAAQATRLDSGPCRVLIAHIPDPPAALAPWRVNVVPLEDGVAA